MCNAPSCLNASPRQLLYVILFPVAAFNHFYLFIPIYPLFSNLYLNFPASLTFHLLGRALPFSPSSASVFFRLCLLTFCCLYHCNFCTPLQRPTAHQTISALTALCLSPLACDSDQPRVPRLIGKLLSDLLVIENGRVRLCFLFNSVIGIAKKQFEQFNCRLECSILLFCNPKTYTTHLCRDSGRVLNSYRLVAIHTPLLRRSRSDIVINSLFYCYSPRHLYTRLPKPSFLAQSLLNCLRR